MEPIAPGSVPPARVKVTVSAHVLIVDRPVDGAEGVKVLLARLAYKDHRGRKWSFPGGYVDQGEEIEQALRREVSEEIDLDLRAFRHVATVPVLRSECPNIGFIYLCEGWSGSPVIKSHEILETAWVDEATFWRLEREGHLAYPQMRDQMSCLGWRCGTP